MAIKQRPRREPTDDWQLTPGDVRPGTGLDRCWMCQVQVTALSAWSQQARPVAPVVPVVPLAY